MTDSTLQRTLKSVFISIMGLLALAAAILLASRLMPLSKVQKAALTALESSANEMPGSNAYSALITLNLEGLTPQQRQARVDAFIPRYNQWQDTYLARVTKDKESDHTVADEAPKLLAEGDQAIQFDERLCSFNDAAVCLDKVRGQPEIIATALAAQADLVQRIGALSAYRHYREPAEMTAGISSPIAPANLLATPLATHANAYLQGDVQGAMTGLCRDAATGRMLMAHGSMLLPTMVGGAMLSANTNTLASILSELPADTPLPATCTTALAPLTAMEASTCTGMRGEFAMRAAHFRAQQANFSKVQAGIFFNDEKSSARTAETMAWPCLPDNQMLIADDRPLPPAPQLSLRRLECAANYIGCIMSAIAAPAYDQYAARQQDVGAQLRLLQAILWLREHTDRMAGKTLAQRVQALPPALRDGPRSIRVGDGGETLELPAYASNTAGKPLSMPVPKALLGTAGTGNVMAASGP